MKEKKATVAEVQQYIKDCYPRFGYSILYENDGSTSFEIQMEIRDEHGFWQYKTLTYKGKDAIEILLYMRKIEEKRAKSEYEAKKKMVKLLQTKLDEFIRE